VAKSILGSGLRADKGRGENIFWISLAFALDIADNDNVSKQSGIPANPQRPALRKAPPSGSCLLTTAGRGVAGLSRKRNRKAADAKYRKAHRAEITASKAIYREAHKAQIAAYNAGYNKIHKTQKAIRGAKRYKEHKTQIAAQCTVYRKTHKIQTAATVAAWHKGHMDKVRDIKARRRALKAGATVEKVNRALVYERDSGRCHLCGRKVNPKKWHLDHIIPLSKGGEHSYRNVAVACPKCNMSKGAKVRGQLRLY